VTFAGPKRGHFRFPGAAACGELVVADINIADTLPEVAAVKVTLATAQMARTLLPGRPRHGHKGTFGTALIVAGSAHYWGAPVLAARGAYRAGAGLVALAVPDVIRATVAGQVPATAVLDSESADFILSALPAPRALLIGPGLGSADTFMSRLLAAEQALPPLVIDADGLNILAGRTAWSQQLPAKSVLTPHPGEMARLMGSSLPEIKAADRVELAMRMAQEWDQIVLLKGAYTVIASPDGHCTLLPFANPLLAVGGSGDVLAGMIAAYLAQGVAPYEAAVLGAYMHGAAGELASEVFGQAGLLAGELADWIPTARRRVSGIS
jgi:hydroxyethylthiazole kinase-like uncharacterized protein yjeF